MKSIHTFFFCFCLSFVAQARVFYVASDAPVNPSADGLSWGHAFTDIQDAVDASDYSGTDSIFVKGGTYHPTSPSWVSNVRESSFRVNKPVKLFGGFIGTEASLSERTLDVSPTTLSGDLGTLSVATDNAYNVIQLSNQNGIELDGFIIRDGYADGNGNDSHGGGLIIKNLSNAVIRNLVLQNNYAKSNGGGLYVTGIASLTIEDIVVLNNQANKGGGIYLSNLSLTSINGLVMTGNQASSDGGGVAVLQVTTLNLVNALIYGNIAGARGGALYGTGFSLVNVVHSTVYSNQSGTSGGGIHAHNAANLKIYNSILWNNSVGGATNADAQLVQIDLSSASTTSSIMGGSQGSGPNWTSQASDGGNNQDADPQFADPTNGNFYLQPTSPASNSASSSSPNMPTEDIVDEDRVQDGTPDMGAFEGFGTGSTFPVEWLTFEATPYGEQIALTWATAQEVNSARFVIERRIEGQEWTERGDVKAAGHSDQVQNYQFADPVDVSVKELLYRLRQVDLDGSVSYSETRRVLLSAASAVQLTLFPNPSQGVFHVQVQGLDLNEPMALSILSPSGQVVHQQEIQQTQEISVSLENQHAGMYLLRLQHPRGLIQQKVLLTR